jgi:signal transduction histidine kinase
MLQAEVFGPLNETQQGKIRLIIESSNHLREFVDNLLAQSELEAGKLALQANQISPKKLMQELASGVQVLADQKGLELTSELDPTLPETILGDRYWLRRIIANLLSNAIKFTAQGRIGLAFRRVEESYWAIEVSDTGPGISPDELSKIFEPFQKGGDTRPPVSGAGLGLAIVKDVVEQMGGRITVQSTLNQGSTFTVLLPLEMPTEKEA